MTTWKRGERRSALRVLARFGRPHHGPLAAGLTATVGVVLIRLALPWPLRGVVEVVFPGRHHHHSSSVAGVLPAWGDPILWLTGAYLLLAAALGILELWQRTRITMFTCGTAHDLRAAAIRHASGLGARRVSTGDVVARAIGDTARIKAGMTGILIQGLRNGLLFVGICAVLLWVSPALGGVFVLAGSLAIGIGIRASRPVAERASRQRRKEGRLAAVVETELTSGAQQGDAFDDLNASSKRKEVQTTRIIARTSLLVHVVVALTVSVALWIGTRQVRAGALAPGDVFLFIAYSISVHRRLEQLGRQGARSGKVLACVNRVAGLLETGDAPEPTPRAPSGGPVTLAAELRVEDLGVAGGRGRAHRPLRHVDCALAAGSRVAVVGAVGAGKSSLLSVLAGRQTPDRGRVLCDGREATPDALREHASFLAQECTILEPAKVWRFLGLEGPEAAEAADTARILSRTGARHVIESLARGLEAKVTSAELTRAEARALHVAALLLHSGDERSLWVLDGPLGGLDRRRARKRLRTILEHAGDRTLIVSLSWPIDIERFDRVLDLHKGKLCFDGTPAEWATREDARRAKRRDSSSETLDNERTPCVL